MSVEEEIKLIVAAKKDIKAFDKLYELYLPKILSFCINRLLNLSNAEDVTSQVFLKAIQKIKMFDPKKGYGFGPWIYKIAHNEIIDYFRRNKAFIQGLEEIDAIEIPDFDREVSIDEKKVEVAKVLSQMNPRYQEIITLKFYAELKNEEIAFMLKEKTSNIALVLHRALKDFKKKYEKLYPNKSEILNLDLRTS